MNENELVISMRGLTIKTFGMAVAHQAALVALLQTLSASQRQALEPILRTCVESSLALFDDGPFSDDLRASVADSANGLINELKAQ